MDIPKNKTKIEAKLIPLIQKYSIKTRKNIGIVSIIVIMQMIMYFLMFIKI